MCVKLVLLAALLILGCAAWLRAPEYDEAYSIFITAGDPRPAWPAGVFHPADTRYFYRGDASPAQIALALRQGDVHPPLYFWLLEYWRRLAGPGWFAARLLSVLLSIAGLACIAWVAALAEIPAPAAMLIALLSYGFAYTGIIARDFALAQTLNIIGMALALSATQNPKRAQILGLGAGLSFGAAAFSNYLAVFPGIATLFWLALRHPRRILLPAGFGFALFLPALLSFFHAQQHSRIGQFQPFSLIPACALMAKDFGAAMFGGLPVYAGHAGSIVTAALAMLSLICAGFIVKNWQKKLTLFALGAISVPAGLLALGLAFNNTPIEIRYLGFASPYLALLLAQTLPPGLRYLLLSVQAGGIIGLIFATSTMQPQGLAAGELAGLAKPNALVLLPFGNDGVGVPGPFIARAPDNLNIELVKPEIKPDLAGQRGLIVAVVEVDESSRQSTSFLLASMRADPCWKPLPGTDFMKPFVQSCPNLGGKIKTAPPANFP